MLKYLIFDLDGTLIDSSKCIFAVYTSLFNELGIPIPAPDTLSTFIGPPIEEVIVRYYKGDIKSACARFREIYAEIDLAENNSLFPYIKEMLEILKKKGYILCVATTKYHIFAEKILALTGIRDYFDFVAGSSEGITGKTAVLNELFKKGAEKDKCLLIGDTIFDIEGAEDTGIPVAIVRYGFGRESDFLGKDIIWFADSVTEIAEKVENTVLVKR